MFVKTPASYGGHFLGIRTQRVKTGTYNLDFAVCRYVRLFVRPSDRPLNCHQAVSFNRDSMTSNVHWKKSIFLYNYIPDW